MRAAGQSDVVGSLLLVGPIDDEWEVVKPLIVQREQDENGDFIVSDEEFDVYGVGESAKDAANDYCQSLIEYYDIVESRAAESAHMMQVFRKLASYLHRRA